MVSKILVVILLICWPGRERPACHLKLPEYAVVPCLKELLEATARSNRQYYPASSYFYSLTFARGISRSALTIEVDRWSDAQDTDYVGTIRIDSVRFLIRGTVEEEPLFKILPSPGIEVTLQPYEGSKDDFVFTREPSLQGDYIACTGERISLEVYTKGEIEGYKMKIPR